MVEIADIKNMDFDQLLETIQNAEHLGSDTGRDLLDKAVERGFKLLHDNSQAPDKTSLFTTRSATLANSGIKSAIDNYTQHLQIHNWHEEEDGNRTFDMSEVTNPDLIKKIKNDMSHFGLKDYVKDQKDGDNIVSIKTRNVAAASNLVSDLVRREDIQNVLKGLGQPENEILYDAMMALLKNGAKLTEITLPMLFNTLKGTANAGWNAITSTLDTVIDKIAEAESPEKMGQVMCEQVLLSPLTLANNFLNELDAAILAWSKLPHAPKAGESSSPEAGEGPAPEAADTSHPATPTESHEDGPTMPRTDGEFRSHMGNLVRAHQWELFRSQYLNALAFSDKEEHRTMAKEVRTLFTDSTLTKEKLDTEHPDLARKMHAALPELMANPTNAQLKNLFVSMDIFPEPLKNEILRQVEALHPTSRPRTDTPRTEGTPRPEGTPRAEGTPRPEGTPRTEETPRPEGTPRTEGEDLRGLFGRWGEGARSGGVWSEDGNTWSFTANVTSTDSTAHQYGTNLDKTAQTITKWHRTGDVREACTLDVGTKKMVRFSINNETGTKTNESVIDLSKTPPTRSEDGREIDLTRSEIKKWTKIHSTYQKAFNKAITRDGSLTIAEELLATPTRARLAFQNLRDAFTKKDR